MEDSRVFRLPGLTVALLTLTAAANAQDAVIRYLANEGVMFQSGETTVLFDPLYNESFDRYQVVPDDVRAAIFAGDTPVKMQAPGSG